MRTVGGVVCAPQPDGSGKASQPGFDPGVGSDTGRIPVTTDRGPQRSRPDAARRIRLALSDAVREADALYARVSVYGTIGPPQQMLSVVWQEA
jgi:hypothetical protein